MDRSDIIIQFSISHNRLYEFAVADRPGNLNAVGVASRSVLLDWEEPDVNGVLQEYRVAVFFGSMTISMDTIASNITTFNVSRLQPFTEYMFEVVAVNGAGVGGKAVLNITTDQDGKGLKTWCLVRALLLCISYITKSTQTELAAKARALVPGYWSLGSRLLEPWSQCIKKQTFL